MEFRLLGPLEVIVDGREVIVGSPRQRALLLLLLLDAGRAVSVDRLVEQLWDGAPPPKAVASLRSHLSVLRKHLAAGGDSARIVTRGRGYMLEAPVDAIDSQRFERLAAAGRAALLAGDADLALTLLDEALRLWRGDALVDVAYEAFAQAPIARLTELRATAREDRIDALLAVGRDAQARSLLEPILAEHPLRERPHALLVRALYRAGRAADAIAAYRTFTARLREETGLEPSGGLAALAEQVLRRDPALDLAEGSVAGMWPLVRPMSSVVSQLGDAPGQRGPQIVGRARERRVLQGAIERLVDGDGGGLLLAGEAGIGKTALAIELAAMARDVGASVHESRCDEFEVAVPYWPWVQLLRSIAADLDDDTLHAAAADVAAPVTQLVDEIALRLGERVAAVGITSENARHALFDAVTTFCARVAARGPLVLVLDDLHFADPVSLQLLRFLAVRLLGTHPVLLVGTYRSLPADRSSELDETLAALMRVETVEVVAVAGLGASAVARLLTELANGRPPSEQTATTVRERTGGNPFFIRQVGALLADGDEQVRLQQVPTQVRQVIVRRLARLAPEVRSLLEVAAVAGQSFDAGVIAAADDRPLDTVLDVLDEAARHGLVRQGSLTAGRGLRYEFAHGLVNETIDAELPAGRATRLHAAVGLALEGRAESSAAAVAEHLWLSADLVGYERVVRALRAAADSAMEVFCHDGAADHLRRALVLLTREPAASMDAELEVRVQLVHILTSRYGWTTDAIDPVIEPIRSMPLETGIDGAFIPLWWTLWTCDTTRGDMRRSSELAATLLAAAELQPPGAGHVAAHVAVAYSAIHAAGDGATALAHCAAAREAERSADPAMLASTAEHVSVALRVTEAQAHAVLGDVEAAYRVGDEAIAVARTVGNPLSEVYARMFGGWTAAYLDDATRTLAITEPAVAECEERGFRYVLELTTPAHEWARAQLGGDAVAAAERITTAVDTVLAAGHRHAAAQWLLLLSATLRLAGDPSAADRRIAEARAISDATGEGFYAPLLGRLSEVAAR